jgi:hypothetical protein
MSSRLAQALRRRKCRLQAQQPRFEQQSHLEPIQDELFNTISGLRYPELTKRVMRIIRKWEVEFEHIPKSWSKVIKRDGTKSSERAMPRVVKEFNESAPIIDRLEAFVRENEQLLKKKPCTIVDLCSGFGIMGMLLAELLPSHLVERIVLVDRQWPLVGQDKPNPNQISWDHVYAKQWSIPLETHKRDIKKGRELKSLGQRLLARCEGPVCVCAVHLCGSLSLRAAQIYNNVPNVAFFALKPCCLPGVSQLRQKMFYTAGKHRWAISRVIAGVILVSFRVIPPTSSESYS